MISIKNVAIIAGEGTFPLEIKDLAEKAGIKTLLIGIKGSCSDTKPHYEYYPHQIPQIIQTIKQNKIQHILFLGRVKKSSINKLIFSTAGCKLFYQIMKNGISDKSILHTVTKHFEDHGLSVLQAEELFPQMRLGQGILTTQKPSQSDMANIEYGVKAMRHISAIDVGQSLIVQNRCILGIEGAEGTNELIKRCMPLQLKNQGNTILIKCTKIFQDVRIDMPCIGPDTLKTMLDYNVSGVAADKDAVILSRDSTLALANNHRKFIIGV